MPGGQLVLQSVGQHHLLFIQRYIQELLMAKKVGGRPTLNRFTSKKFKIMTCKVKGFILYFKIDHLVSMFRVPDSQCVL